MRRESYIYLWDKEGRWKMEKKQKRRRKRDERGQKPHFIFYFFFLNSKKGGKGKTRRSIPEPSQWTRCLAHSLRRDESGSVEREPAPWFHTHYHLLQRHGEWENETAHRDCAKSPVFVRPRVFTSRSLSHNALISLYYMLRVLEGGARVRSRCLSPSPKLSPLVVTLPVLCAKARWRSLWRETLWVKGKVLSVLGCSVTSTRVSDKFWCLSPGLLLRDNVRIIWLGLKPPFLFSLNHFIHLYFPSALSSLFFNFLS